jgi:branched-chain amino acid transport system substrate-binding protein
MSHSNKAGVFCEEIFQWLPCFVVFIFAVSFSLTYAQTIKVAFDIELPGDIPKLGEGSKFAAEMLKEELNGAGGIRLGGRTYNLDFVYEDNEAKVESPT